MHQAGRNRQCCLGGLESFDFVWSHFHSSCHRGLGCTLGWRHTRETSAAQPGHEPLIKIHHSTELQELADRLWPWKFHNRLHLVSRLPIPSAETSERSLTPMALCQIQHKPLVPESAEQLCQVRPVLIPVPARDQNVI